MITILHSQIMRQFEHCIGAQRFNVVLSDLSGSLTMAVSTGCKYCLSFYLKIAHCILFAVKTLNLA